MGLFSNIFSSSSVIEKSTDAIINGVDKLIYTEEEKSDAKKEYAKMLPTIMKAFEPFKLAQRYLAFAFMFLFGSAFLTGLGMTIFNIIYKYKALNSNIKDINLLDITPLYNLVSSFSLGMIMLAIVSFYFGAGAIESFKRK